MQYQQHQELIHFLNTVEAEVPSSKVIHVVLDNYATHRHPKVRNWLVHHPRWTFHFVRTSCSWLNAVEGFFAKLIKRRLKRGVFHSIIDLQAAIKSFIVEANKNPKHFAWTADPNHIIDAVQREKLVMGTIHWDSGLEACSNPSNHYAGANTAMRRALCTVFLANALMTLSDAALADQTSLSHTVISEASRDLGWQKLIHHKQNLFRDGRSSILSEKFFLASNGQKDPEVELTATLNAFESRQEGKDDDVVCSHPARALYLRRKFGLSIPDPFVNCPEFAAFSSHGEANAISVLFISGYLQNPGSAFGHLLLRFHTEEDINNVQDVLDQAINYGVAESVEDPLPLYIIKGLFGGYQSRFTTLKFFHQNERYRESQLRDIWEYRLNLTNEKIRLFIAHIWELLPTQNRYFFLRQNCAYYVAEALEVVVDKDLIPSSKAWLAPIDVIHRLTDNIDGNAPIVKSVRRLASREKLFLEGYARLDAEEQSLVSEVIADVNVPFAEFKKSSALTDLRPALNVLLDYYAFQEGKEAEHRRSEILAARFALPAPLVDETQHPVAAPHEGQRPSLLRLTGLYNSQLGSGTELRLRPAYFDFLSETKDSIPYGELAIADTQVVFRSNDVSLRRLEALRVTNLDPITKDRLDEDRNAWRIRFGAEQRDLACENCLVGFFETGIGKARELYKGTVMYGLLSGRLEAGSATESLVSLKPQAGFIWKSEEAAFEMGGGLAQGIAHIERSEAFGHAELRISISSQWDLRARIEFDAAFEETLSISYYW